MRRRKVIAAQTALFSLPKDLIIHKVRPGNLPLADDAVLFYPFNSLSNMTAVTNRDVHHVLTLHGESNKFASNRPTARLYDYICVAGPLGRDRYISNRIFTKDDVDRGRLIMMGDSFVQAQQWIQPADSTEDGAVLYCPTWEGYGNQTNNFSSITDLSGFEACRQISRALGTQAIVIKPHPYLGLLRRGMFRKFIEGVRGLVADGFSVQLALSDANIPLKLLCRMTLTGVQKVDVSDAQPVKVRMGVCDISGMEAIFLKQRVPHMVMSRGQAFPDGLTKVYSHKAIIPGDDMAKKALAYNDDAEHIDTCHRELSFGWHDPSLQNMTGPERRAWLIDYVRQNPFWRNTQRGEQ
ncbi:hypothetical protein EOK75_08725 [Pseudorhodobacter turbinis]|uniref:Uncharacterized protein n=1 Tax=Pseudorhodobacter turbinis TaxID=2500533 RepID=A0A4P8EG21_9RHOB|nr:hypothetical protein [Pseudorhodobacter turbinis]QCO55818.1 hypothetical protein EOK75_08725 [Pseudorhodobacter turbinis]